MQGYRDAKAPWPRGPKSGVRSFGQIDDFDAGPHEKLLLHHSCVGRYGDGYFDRSEEAAFGG